MDSSTPSEPLGFPQSYLFPMHTAVGLVFPGPKLRDILERLENVQKRMATTKMMAHPARLQKVYAKKEERQAKFEAYKQDFQELQKEFDAIEAQLMKNPLTPEHFMHPQWNISYCCKVRVRDVDATGQKMEKPCCSKCGRDTAAYRRLDKEDWPTEYQQVIVQRNADLKAERAAIAAGEKKKPETDKPQGFVPYAGGPL